MNDTPETDAAAAIITRQSDYGMSGYVSADFAKNLERQRNILLEALEELIDVGCEFYDMDCGENGSVAISAAREAIASVKEAKQ